MKPVIQARIDPDKWWLGAMIGKIKGKKKVFYGFWIYLLGLSIYLGWEK